MSTKETEGVNAFKGEEVASVDEEQSTTFPHAFLPLILGGDVDEGDRGGKTRDFTKETKQVKY